MTTYANSFENGVVWTLSRLRKAGQGALADAIAAEFWSIEEQRQASLRLVRSSGAEILGDLSMTGYQDPEA